MTRGRLRKGDYREDREGFLGKEKSLWKGKLV